MQQALNLLQDLQIDLRDFIRSRYTLRSKLKNEEMSSDIKVKKAAVQVNQDLVDTLADMNNEILKSELRMMGFSEAVVDMMEGIRNAKRQE